MLRNLINNEDGFVISAELVLVLTIGVIGVIVGLSHVATAINTELTDVATAIGSLNQSYCFTGYFCCPCPRGHGPSAWTTGSCFFDSQDTCDFRHDVVSCGAANESNGNGGGNGGGHGGHGGNR